MAIIKETVRVERQTKVVKHSSLYRWRVDPVPDRVLPDIPKGLELVKEKRWLKQDYEDSLSLTTERRLKKISKKGDKLVWDSHVKWTFTERLVKDEVNNPKLSLRKTRRRRVTTYSYENRPVYEAPENLRS